MGFSCTIKKSETTVHCGIWSYQKLATIPKMEEEQYVSLQQCQDIVNKMSYQTPNGKEVPLKPNVEVTHHEVEGGVL